MHVDSSKGLAKPLVSVVMSVRNGMPYLPEAVASILTQTLTDFEFIILDNASKDNSVAWLEQIEDPRIRLVKNEIDLGLSGSLNRGFSLARGKYVARMDADDISLPNRLAVQVDFLEKHPDVVLCGGIIEQFDDKHSWQWDPPHGQDAILSTLLFQVPFAHPAVMYRKSAWEEYTLFYDESLKITQDYDMWRRIGYELSLPMENVSECILQYRIQGQNLSVRAAEQVKIELASVFEKILQYFCGEKPSEHDKSMYLLCFYRRVASSSELGCCIKWLYAFKQSVTRKGIITRNMLDRTFCEQFHALLASANKKGIWVVSLYLRHQQNFCSEHKWRNVLQLFVTFVGVKLFPLGSKRREKLKALLGR